MVRYKVRCTTSKQPGLTDQAAGESPRRSERADPLVVGELPVLPFDGSRARGRLRDSRIPTQYRQGTRATALHRRVGLSLCDGSGKAAQAVRWLRNTHIEALVETRGTSHD